MRQTMKRYIRAGDDTVLLALYGACWLLALFAPSEAQRGLGTAGRALSAIALTIVALLWIVRPAIRPGWRLRDVAVILVLLVAAFQAHQSLIRSPAVLALLQTLEAAAIFTVVVHLCVRRPQPLFLITLLLLGGATALVWRWQRPLFPMHDPIFLAEIFGLFFLAVLPWLAVRRFRSWGRGYSWLVLAVGVALIGAEASGAVAGHPNWIRLLARSWSAETRQVVAAILRDSWIVGCGPGEYEWLFRASMPEEFASQIAMAPTALMVLIERGAVGLAAFVALAAAMLWRFRPGPWAAENPAVLDLARPLRWVAGFVFLIFLATPSLRSTFGQIVLWSLLGMLRAWSCERPPAAVSLVAGGPAADAASLRDAGEPSWGWMQSFLVVGAVLAGVGLVVFDIRPLVGAAYRRLPPNMALSDPAFLDRIELARWWWPYDPRTHELEAAHYRAKSQNQPLSSVEIEAVTLAYERMIRANPYDPMGHLALARWERARGDPQKEIEVARRGLAFCPASFELQYYLAGSCRRQDNTDLARAEYQRAYQLRPRSVPVLLNLADLELRQGRAAEARRYLQIAAQIRPDDRSVGALLRAVVEGRPVKIPDVGERDSDVQPEDKAEP
jgi:hypothetical protein